MGFMYQNGEGVAQDLNEAVKWWRRAAEQGYLLAQYNLGAAYYEGQGVPQDKVRALMWLFLSASTGDKDAVETQAKVSQAMSADQIRQAQQRASDCKEKKFKDCD